ncbi:MAG: hypothetical protein C4530_13560 [Desulfobacteraceae bacterium]|nr:MAG: hypothetical protein C4530_13560 [Desulfobacteraceae bacterium]
MAGLPHREKRLVKRMRGQATIRTSTDEIPALTREGCGVLPARKFHQVLQVVFKLHEKGFRRPRFRSIASINRRGRGTLGVFPIGPHRSG